MNPYDYALGLFSVLIGLALADIAVSLHKLIRNVRTIRWDARAIVSCVLVIVVIIRMWFELWSIRDVGIVLHFPFYVSLFVELMILFLLASSCLPDEPSEECDLGDFYENNRPSLWTIFALFQTSYFLHWLYFSGWSAPFASWAIIAWPIGCYVLLALVRRPAIHIVLPAALIAWEFYGEWHATLG